MTTSQTIHSIPAHTGKLYGVELEIEAAGLYEPEEIYDEASNEYYSNDVEVPSGWLLEPEDSIQGCELVSKQPFDLVTTEYNINYLFKDIKFRGYAPIRTPRGSTHVHANVADLTWAQMRSFVMACAWAEPVLIELAGKGRKGNLFAQSYVTTPIGWGQIIEWCRLEQIIQRVDTHYMAISFRPMSSFGSVEFRMGPSARNAEEAIQWLRYIDTVVTAGREEHITNVCPAFMYGLLGELSPRVAERVFRQAQRQAEEIFAAIQEPCYPKPSPKKARKSAAVPSNWAVDDPAISESTLMAATELSPDQVMSMPPDQYAMYMNALAEHEATMNSLSTTQNPYYLSINLESD